MIRKVVYIFALSTVVAALLTFLSVSFGDLSTSLDAPNIVGIWFVNTIICAIVITIVTASWRDR